MKNPDIAYADSKLMLDAAIGSNGLINDLPSIAAAVQAVQRLNQWRRIYREQQGRMTAYDEFIIRRRDNRVIIERRPKMVGSFMTLDGKPIQNPERLAAEVDSLRQKQQELREGRMPALDDTISADGLEISDE